MEDFVRVSRRTEAPNWDAHNLFRRSAVVLGRPHPREASCLDTGGMCVDVWCFCSMGAAEDGRAPTEEVACIPAWGFCSTSV
jgi:hypothetical protein